MEGEINRQKTVQVQAAFLGVACRELVHQPLLLPFAFLVVGTVSLAWDFLDVCASRLILVSPGCIPKRLIFFALVSPYRSIIAAEQD